MSMTQEHIACDSKAHIDAHDRLIFALDVPSIEEAQRLVDELNGVVSFFKIGLELFAATGLEMVSRLTRAGKQVFLDLKYYDVPETVKGAVEQSVAHGVKFLTIHGNGENIKYAIEGRGNSGVKLLSVTALTSLDNDDMKDLGLKCTVQDYVMHRARRALELGCDGVIASPREADKIRALSKEIKGMDDKFLIVTPGVRPLDSGRDDHKRKGTPTESINAGADYLVMGRPIRDAENPRAKAEEIIAEMQAAFDSRQ
jgi:orotidine-5'-phosphate decarboxylase